MTGEYQSVSEPVTVGTTPEVQYGYSTPGTGSVQTSMTYPNGRVIDYTYATGLDAAIGRVTGIADAAGSDAGDLQSYSYLGSGTILGEVDGNGVTETTSLDNFGRTSELKYVNASGTTTDNFQYGYDQDSNVLYQANGLNSTFSQLYTYDSLNRLTGYQQGTLNSSDTSITGTPTASQSWTYDALGNQNTVTTNGTVTTNTTNSKNELSTSGASSLAYDNDGNMLTDENGQTYTYDAWNRMVSAKNSSGTTIATYSYDPQGRRITEASGGTRTEIYFSNQWQDIEERQEGIVTRQNVWGIGYVNQLVERDDSSVNGNLGTSSSGLGQRLYAQQNNNWSVVSLVDASGNVVQRTSFTPYGMRSFLTGIWAPTSDTYDENILFQGGELEAATGQYEFQERDYDPRSGSWLEQDPSGYTGSANFYLFESCEPAQLTDSTGLVAPPAQRPRTKAEDIKVLQDQIAQWHVSHYDFSVALLQAYLNQGQVALNQFQMFAPLIQNSQEFRDHAKSYFQDYVTNNAQNLALGANNIPDILPPTKYAFEFGYYNAFYWPVGDLGWALGGAHFGYKNVTLTISQSHGGRHKICQVKGTMIQYDVYNFPPSSIRQAFDSYEAAYDLEANHGYKSFPHQEEWQNTFSFTY